MNNTGIICTMGPATRSKEVLTKMLKSGMTMIRFNFSHGTFAEYEKDFELIRTLNNSYYKSNGEKLKILVDLEGHRIRIGALKNNKIKLTNGEKLILTDDNIIGDNKKIYIDYKNSLTDITSGCEIFIDDGNLVLKVLSSKNHEIVTEIKNDYILKSYKGINIPKAKLKFPKIEQKDIDGMIFALKHGVDIIANSFVRYAEDMTPLLNILNNEGNTTCKLVAKIEDRLGIDNLEEIIKVSDGIMIARGDLGISIPMWTLPIEQKRIIKQCKIYNKFVIIATQMIESMIKNHIPTRAEVSDVANAVIDGANYVMLSAETAIGKHPDKVVKIINNIISFTEKNSMHI